MTAPTNMSQEITEKITSHLGDGVVEQSQEVLARHQLCGVSPSVLVEPTTPEQVAGVLALAHQEGWHVVPWGSGQGMANGRPPRQYDIALSVNKLKQIIDYDQENLTLTAEAGATLSAANQAIASGHQFLPLGWSDDSATLGGLISSNPLPPKRLLYGDPRDLLLGIRVALPDGRLVRYGRKVIKNVAGYDMNKLFLGSQGMMGVIVEVTCKLFALPDEEAIVVAGFSGQEQATRAAGELLASKLLPAYVYLLDGPSAHAFCSAQPIANLEAKVLLVAGFDGRSVTLRRQRSDSTALCQRHGATHLETLSTLSPGARRVMAGQPANFTGHQATEVFVRLGMPTGALLNWMNRLPEDTSMLQPTGFAINYGAGCLRVSFPAAVEEKKLAGWLAKTRTELAQQGGFAVVEQAPANIFEQISPWETTGAMEVMRRLQIHFDPNGVMCPERFLSAGASDQER